MERNLDTALANLAALRHLQKQTLDLGPDVARALNEAVQSAERHVYWCITNAQAADALQELLPLATTEVQRAVLTLEIQRFEGLVYQADDGFAVR